MVVSSRWVARCAIVIALAGLGPGCGGQSPNYVESHWRQPAAITLDTPGLRILADDDSFELNAGAPARSPFWSFDCPGRPIPGNAELGLRLGGQRVTVHHPAHDEPLHGVLSLCRVHIVSNAPVARSYSVRVPDNRVEEAVEGVSVVYEQTGYSINYEGGPVDVPGWILWLSRVPL